MCVCVKIGVSDAGTPQIHSPLKSFVSLIKRSSLGTRNSEPFPAQSGLNSIAQNGNTDNTSMKSMPVESKMVMMTMSAMVVVRAKVVALSEAMCNILALTLTLTFGIFAGRHFARILHRLEHGRVWV